MEEPLCREGATLKPRVPFAEFKLDRQSGEALHRQINEFVRGAVLNGELTPGAQLPSTRALARRLRISRNTVLNAYESLANEGFLTGKVGSGTLVRERLVVSDQLARKPLSARRILRESHYPSESLPIYDPDGNLVYLQR